MHTFMAGNINANNIRVRMVHKKINNRSRSLYSIMPDKNNMQACDRTILFLSVFYCPSHLIQTGKIIALTVAIADPHHMVR
ncbi:hypothetical protein RE93_15575 [Klebsiella pneumoniae]|nr:hypothetical protein AM275_03995 [Klebsiella pneumoniae]OCR52211.1 hypothetical protein QH74_14225 [Klebsiella pneumoniae]OCR66022.1 hypothetical protein RE93_15575 [Klebsiella pneumoniae]